MGNQPVDYLLGSLCGLVAVVVTTPILGVPSSFAVFAVRALGIVFVASLLGLWAVTRYTGT